MKASERLRELRIQPVVYTDGDFRLREGFSADSLQPLLAALPLIADVVEAAERLETWDQETEEFVLRCVSESDEDHLRARLTALNNALEGGDVT